MLRGEQLTESVLSPSASPSLGESGGGRRNRPSAVRAAGGACGAALTARRPSSRIPVLERSSGALACTPALEQGGGHLSLALPLRESGVSSAIFDYGA